MRSNTKKTVAVIFGGQSAEHDVSIITAHIPVIPALLAMGTYRVVPIYIAKDGSWYSNEAMNDIAYFKQPDLEEHLRKEKRLQLSFEEGLILMKPGFAGAARETRVDVVFPTMHGTFGEDGSLMGLLRMAQVPFVGCDLSASAVAMDKVLTKQVVAAEGIPVVPYVWFTSYEWERQRAVWQERVEKLTWPLFVKPVHLGSSIAIAKVKDAAALERAVEVALHYDDKVLVEESVEHLIEVTLPIMGNEELRLAAIERPHSTAEFFDFNGKYLSSGAKGSGTTSELPAHIAPDLAHEVEELGKKVYRTLGCSGTARVDFLIDSARHQVFVNEVNTLPGSLYHHNWKEVGVSNVALVGKLVELAEERFACGKKLTRTFSSAILDKVGGGKL